MPLPKPSIYVITHNDLVQGDAVGTALSAALGAANKSHKDLMENINYLNSFTWQSSNKTFTDNNYTITPEDCSLFFDSTNGNITINLPTAIGKMGRFLSFKKVKDDSVTSKNYIAVTAFGSELVDSEAIEYLDYIGDSIFIQSDGSNWQIMGGTHNSTSNVETLTTGTYRQTLRSQINDSLSTGWIAGGTIVDIGGGTFAVSAGEGFIRTTNESEAPLYYGFWEDNTFATSPGDKKYVYVNYNSNDPIVLSEDNLPQDGNTNIYLGQVNNVSGVLHIFFEPKPAGDYSKRVTDWLANLVGTRVAGGETVSCPLSGGTGTGRKIAVTEGDVFDRHFDRIATDAFDSSNSTGPASQRYFSLVHTALSGDGFTRISNQTEWDNQNYDNNGTLTALSAGSYSNVWVMRNINGEVAAMYGQNQWVTPEEATTEGSPSQRPPEFDAGGYFVGQITFQKNAATAASIVQIKPTIGAAFGASNVNDHNNLSGLQGGAGTNRWHISQIPVLVSEGGTGTTTGSITGSGALVFAAGGSNQNVTITPSGSGYTLLNGKVGIGKSIPAQKLHLYDGGSTVYLAMERYTGISSFGTDAIGTYLGNDSNIPIYFATNSSERLRITGDGITLINTTSTLDNNYKLNVNGGIYTTKSINTGIHREVSIGNINTLRNVYSKDISTATGFLKITLPVSWTSNKIKIVVSGYNSSDITGAWKVELGGFNQASSWSNTSVTASAGLPFEIVKFAHDGTKCCILLGESTNSWTSTYIKIEEVTISNTVYSTTWESGWNLEFLTSLTGITVSTTPFINGNGLIVNGEIKQLFEGRIRTITPSGSAAVREWGDQDVNTTGKIEFGVSYNVNIASAIWTNRDIDRLCWLEKLTGSTATKEYWFAPSSGSVNVPAWVRRYKLELINNILYTPNTLYIGAGTTDIPPVIISSGGALSIRPGADSTTAIQILKADGTTPVVTVDTTNGRVGFGTNVANAMLNITSVDTTDKLHLSTYYTDVTGSNTRYKHARGTVASPTPLVNGDDLGQIIFQGYDGATFLNGAQIRSSVAGAVSSGVMPGDIQFLTNQGYVRMIISSGGNVGFGGITVPTAAIHLPAGTTVANTAPLKFTTGSLLTTPEAGAVEFLANAWYGTITTGAARKTFAFLESPTIITPTIASIIGNKIYPAADSTTAIQILKADGTTPVVTVDTTNGRVGIGTATPLAGFVGNKLHIYDNTSTNYWTGLGLENAYTGGRHYQLFSTNNNSGIGGGKLGIHDYTAGQYRLVLDSSGNVGIGLISPKNKLDVSGTYQSSFVNSEGTYSLLVGSVEGFSNIGVAISVNVENSGGNLYGLSFGTTNGGTTGYTWQPRMTITAAGNVGIGTPNPGSKLHVLNTAGQTTIALFTTNDYAVGVGSVLRVESVAASGNTAVGLQATINGQDTAGNLILQQNNGNVGIGTPNPKNKLDVSGTYQSSFVNSEGTYSLLVGSVEGFSNIGVAISVNVENSGGNLYGLSFGTTNGGTTGYTWQPRMTITAAGNVGIGTTTPNTLLSLQGSTGLSFRNSISSSSGSQILPTGDAGGLTFKTDSGRTGELASFAFSTYSGGYADRFVINASGNSAFANTLRIGNIGPQTSYTLRVDGTANITSNLTVSGTITGTLATAAQPNITSVGTLTGGTVPLARMMRTEVQGSGTTSVSLNLGTVVTGDRIWVTGQGNAIIAALESVWSKSAGSATIDFAGSSEIRTFAGGGYGNASGVCRVTSGGTLTLQYATNGVSSSSAYGHAIVLNNG